MADDSIVYCPDCGRKCGSEAAYCAGCGRRLDIATESQIREKRWQQAEAIAERATQATVRGFSVVGRAISRFEGLTIFGLWCAVVAFTAIAILAVMRIQPPSFYIYIAIAAFLWIVGLLLSSVWALTLLARGFAALFRKRNS